MWIRAALPLALSTALAPAGTAQESVDVGLQAYPLSAGESLRPLEHQDALRPQTPRPNAAALDAADRPAGHHAQWIGGLPQAHGYDWRARFTDRGVEFTPALGRDEPLTRMLRLRLESIRVGEAELTGLELEAAAELADGTIRYARGRGVVEQYEPRADGIEQSFVFAELPDRSGDLVVRLALEGNVERSAPAGPRSELRLPAGERGAVTLTGVLGFDAAGRTVAGSMELMGDALELRLPAELIAAAELPLTLDPLVGAEIAITDGSYRAENADIAYGGQFDEFAITFERYFSSSDSDIYAAPCELDGALASIPFRLDDTIGSVDSEPSIGWHANQEVFLVAWQELGGAGAGAEVKMASFAQSSFTPRGPVNLATGGGDQDRPDVGGEAIAADSRVVVAYRENGRIRARGVTVSKFVDPAIAWSTDISVANAPGPPAITKSGGTAGRYAVTWDDLSFGNREVFLKTLTVGGSAGTFSTYLNLPATSESRPDIAGNAAGNEWLVVYEQEGSPGSGDRDIVGRRLGYDSPSAGFLGFETLAIEAQVADDDRAPAIARHLDSYLVVWEDPVSNPFVTGSDIGIARVDFNSCDVGQGTESFGAPLQLNRQPAVASRAEDQTSPADDQEPAGIAWDANLTGQPQILFQEYLEGAGGSTVQNVGGGCGSAGLFELVGDTSIGSSAYTARLTSIPSEATIAILNYRVGLATIPCGACAWLPFKNTFVVATVPDTFGKRAEFGLSVPCNPILEGVTFGLQWTVLLTNATPCASSPNISNSDLLSLTLGY